ncbi:COG1361 S-layer family protein [Thermoclostridium caenicola]|uniref:Uncharacterized conserved protein n=1 Tax=Thermoclostridium caenicola TaxID=659425 RepID=A0A1M6DYQ7_9FIRM|nr:hypothetical protein [Thermoclostridium caenicola]SHI78394.1 Uncharacterized conserved protein [Thermoclostridium caenicola]
MKRRMLKRTLHFTLALIFVMTAMLSLLPADVAMATTVHDRSNFKFEADYYNYLSPGENFNFTLTVTNKYDQKITITSIFLNKGAAISVKEENGDPYTVFIGEIGIEPDGHKTVLSDHIMQFVGNKYNNTFSLTINYMFENGEIGNTSVEYRIDVKEDENFETDPYTPILQASVAENASVTAGQFSALNITLKNISGAATARNITFTPVYETGSPFIHVTVNGTSIKEIRPRAVDVIKLSVNTDKFVKPGYYPFKFKLTFTNAWGEDFTTEHIVYINVVNNKQDAKLIVRTSSADNVSAEAGKSFSVPVYVVNSGNYFAKDITITVKGLSQDTFMLSSGSSRITFDRINGGSNQKFTLNLLAAKGLKTASYPLSFKVEYTTESGEKVSEEQEIWIPVTGSGDAVNALEILNVGTSMSTVTPSDIFDVSVTIKNNGNTQTEQIKVSADGTDALLPVTQNLFIVSKLGPNESRTLNFRFQPSPDAKRGSVPIVIKVGSVDGSGNNAMISQAVSVFVDAEGGESDPNKNVPKIIVESYAYEPRQVKAGEQFTLHMSFQNTHSSKTIRNIKGSFNVEEKSNETGNVFTPVDSSNTFFIDEIRPKGTYDWTLNLYTIPDAQSKTYTVILSFAYEDEQGNPYTEQEIIGIPVYQPSRFEMSEFMLPSEAYMGDPIYLNFSIYNMGKTDLYNVKMYVEGDFAADPMSSYFGNFTPGYMEWCEINLIPMQIGVNKGKIVVEYETTSGELMTYEKEFAINVLEMPSFDPGFPVDGGFPMDPGMEDGGNGGFIGSVWFYVIIGVVVVGVVVTIILVVRKRRKNKEFEF